VDGKGGWKGWMERVDGKGGWKGWMERVDGKGGWKGWMERVYLNIFNNLTFDDKNILIFILFKRNSQI
jgi:hypothetical protein